MELTSLHDLQRSQFSSIDYFIKKQGVMENNQKFLNSITVLTTPYSSASVILVPLKKVKDSRLGHVIPGV